MINSNQIKQNFVVVGSMNEPFGAVDQMDGRESIRLKQDERGEIHFIPLSWVDKVDDKVHLNRSAEAARKEWLSAPLSEHRDVAHYGPYEENIPLLSEHAASLEAKKLQDSPRDKNSEKNTSSPKQQAKKHSNSAKKTQNKAVAQSSTLERRESTKSEKRQEKSSKDEKKSHKA